YAAEGNIDDYYEDNRAFHQAVQDLSGNRWLQRVAADLRRIMRLGRHEQLTLPGRLQASLQEHRRIMEAFRSGDADLADRCMQEHLIQQGIALNRLTAHDESSAAV
ncbi:MAG: FCD domain-containing protein, partial [Gammaproteobacteria bacterium]